MQFQRKGAEQRLYVSVLPNGLKQARRARRTTSYRRPATPALRRGFRLAIAA